MLAEKLVWSLLCLVGGVLLLRPLHSRPLARSQVLFLALWFVFPFIDVIDSRSLDFASLFFLGCGWVLLDRPRLLWQLSGALLMTLALFLRPTAIIFPLGLLIAGQWRKLLPFLTAMVGWLVLPLLAFGKRTGLAWWRGWWASLDFYRRAADPGRATLQSPPAALFRLLGDFTSLTWERRLAIAALLGVLLLVGVLWLSRGLSRRGPPGQSGRELLALWVAALFVSTPFSRTSAILFLYPLAALYVERGPVTVMAWLLGISFAVMQSGIVPNDITMKLAHWSVPSALLVALVVIALRRLVSTRKSGGPFELGIFRQALSSS